MSKQISAKELAEIVAKLLTDPAGAGELSAYETYQAFMTDIAVVVCDHCGGEVHHPAYGLDGIWTIDIHGNDSLPSGFGGIWWDYDKEGDLFEEGSPEWFAANATHIMKCVNSHAQLVAACAEALECATVAVPFEAQRRKAENVINLLDAALASVNGTRPSQAVAVRSSS
jgi:hypothetical protein